MPVTVMRDKQSELFSPRDTFLTKGEYLALSRPQGEFFLYQSTTKNTVLYRLHKRSILSAEYNLKRA